MAYVNVAEWKTDQVCEWLKGLESSVLPYVHSFNNSKVNGQQLLSLRPEDLEQLGVLKLGHQEIILEAVEYLRNFHYELDRENLQLLALRLSCQAHSLFNELSRQTDSKPVTTQTLSDVVGVVTAIKPLVRWLDRQPFNGQLEYNDKKCQLLKLSIEMATCAQRDRFAEKPIEEIRTSCYELAKLADYIIQDISDPMILQPASLDLATLKKRPGDDLGFYILPSFHGTHQIAEIKFSSVAHQCGKMEEGDEIVQVNYQTVVGWERKNVLELFNESPSEVLLTLKRRPRHTKVYGQIYIKPYRLPSNKKTPYATRWQHNLPSPRLELLTIPDFTMPLPRPAPKDPSPEPPKAVLDPASTVTDSSESDSEVEPPLSTRLYASKPRSLVQRRATITGASPTTKHGIDIEQFWKELKQEHSTSFQLRDKAASCAHGLDTVSSIQRPQTCLGIEHTKRRRKFDDKKLIDLSLKKNFNGSVVNSETKTPPSPTKNDIIEKSSGDCVTTSDTPVPFNKRQSDDVTNDFQEMKSFSSKLRGKLDKSHSTPAYDVSDTTAIEIDVFESTNTKKITDNSSIKSVKTDKLNSRKKSEKSKINCEKSDNNEVMMEGSVADKIHYLEKKLSDNNHDCNKNINKILDTPKLLNKDETKNCQQDNWEISEQPVILVDPRRQLEHPSSRESSEEKTESTGSYMEGIYSSSSEAEVVDKNKVQNKGEEVRTIPPIAPKREEPEMPKKPEVKVRLTPPEPPPRKYFTKPSPLVLTDPPRVPERPDSKQRPRVDGFEGYREFLERSTDFIDDPTTPIHDRRIDHFSYSEMYDHQMKENRQPIEKYEPFTEKFGNGIVSPAPLPEVTPRESPESIPRDSPDGAGCSTPLSPPESRPRTLEKEKNSEKGVVNRAMMVAARSIGLSGSSKLSSNSPRSNRKRNMLLAKRRNVSVKDIGTGDLEGWLTYRSRGAGGAWARSWFVLKGSSLYRFKTQESSKSDCLIVLPGFTGSQASEVKSRKFAFKVYHTGTVFYFAAETEDSLALWLDAINKATLGSDGSNRTSGLFSETDESDSESSSSKSKPSKSSTENPKSPDKGFGSLKKLGRKDSGAKEHDVAAASLDRKYLRFLSARTPNVPVPTAQFRSYRKVLPSPTPNNNNNNKKSEPVPNSPDLRVTVAGSTFYGLTASQSSTDVPSTSQDMGDYRQTSERSHSSRSRRPDDLRGFVTLEEFMLASQPPQTTPQRSLSNRSASPRMTTFTSEHVPYTETPPRSFNYTTNGMIYGHPRNGEDPPVRPNYTYPRSGEAAYRSEPAFRPDPYATVQEGPWQRRQWEPSGRRRPQEDVVYYPPRTEASYAQRVPPRVIPRVDDAPQVVPRRFIRDNGYSGSSGDLTCCSTASETLQRARREASVSRKGSFNLNDRQEKTWLDSLRRSDKKLGSKTSKTSLKNVAQYQPPPMPNSPFEQEGMRAAFEMHLDKEPKTSRFKNLFRSRSPSSKPNNLDLPKEQKTLLGSPRLHRALFRDRGSSQKRSGSQSPGDSGISQSLSSYSGISQGHTLSQSFSSVSSASDWSPDTPGANNSDKYIIHGSYRRSHRNMNPPTLPYIPPPTSPPPPDDYPGLEYPPVFEPGTYSLSDASLLKDKTKKRPSVDEE